MDNFIKQKINEFQNKYYTFVFENYLPQKAIIDIRIALYEQKEKIIEELKNEIVEKIEKLPFDEDLNFIDKDYVLYTINNIKINNIKLCQKKKIV